MCERGFYATQAGTRTHSVQLQLLQPGWNIVSFRALDGFNSFNLIYIFYPSPMSSSSRDLSTNALSFVASMDAAAAATCLPSPQPSTAAAPPTSSSPSSSSSSSSSPPPPPPPSISIVESHCMFRCPVPSGQGEGGGGEGRALLAITVRNGWAHTQVWNASAEEALLTLIIPITCINFGCRLQLLQFTAILIPLISSLSATAAMMCAAACLRVSHSQACIRLQCDNEVLTNIAPCAHVTRVTCHTCCSPPRWRGVRVRGGGWHHCRLEHVRHSKRAAVVRCVHHDACFLAAPASARDAL